MSEQEQAGRAKTQTVVLWLMALLLAVLVALGLSGAFTHSLGPHPRSRTRYVLQRVHAACANYRLEHMCYPWPTASEMRADAPIDSATVCAELRGMGQSNQRLDYLGPLAPRCIDEQGRMKDRWNNPIHLRVDPDTEEPVIWSFGPDGKDDTNDGESPDPKKKPKTYYWFGKGDFGDDIVVGAEPK